MGEHESQARRAASHGQQTAGSSSLVSGSGPGPEPGVAELGGTARPPSGRSSSVAKSDFRATVGRRLSEERELGPQVLTMLSAHPSSTTPATTSESDPSPSDDPVSPVDQRDEFNAELAHAMQAAMSSAHQRVAQDLERSRTARVDALRERAAHADQGSRERAEQDVAGIDRWVDLETKRIRLQGEHRIAERRAELDAIVAQIRTEVERAIQEIDTAVAEHRAATDVVMVQIAAESDSATIAGLVERLPPAPSLGGIGEEPEAAEGSAAETGERDLVGVMDPGASAATHPSTGR